MAIKLDFLTKEIFIKIITKSLGVFRTLFLLYFFSISNTLDNFYFSKSIIGIVVLINIFFEITYSHQLNTNNINYIKKLNLGLNKLASLASLTLILLSSFYIENQELFTHILILSIWALFNINSNFFLLVFRYKNYNNKVLSYYLLIGILDIILLFLLLKGAYFYKNYISISLSLFLSEFIVFIIIFLNYGTSIYKNGNSTLANLKLQKSMIYKVLIILLIISFIDISDKYFLSYLGEGQITYYTYGLYAPLVIRQSLDIRSNFFVQINVVDNYNQMKIIFFNTLKKLFPFFFAGVLCIIIATEFLGEFIKSTFKINDILLLKKIIYLGLIITPFYMIWDLFYRFYYRENKINRLLVIVFIGLLLNIFLNYLLGIQFSLGIYGILISTLTVFLFYNFLSYKYFFLKHN